jgi:hypothetical protein
VNEISKKDCATIEKNVVEWLGYIRDKSLKLTDTEHPDVSINVLMNVGVELVARSLAIVPENRRDVALLTIFGAIAGKTAATSADIDTQVVLNKIMKKDQWGLFGSGWIGKNSGDDLAAAFKMTT